MQKVKKVHMWVISAYKIFYFLGRNIINETLTFHTHMDIFMNVELSYISQHKFLHLKVVKILLTSDGSACNYEMICNFKQCTNFL